MRTYRQCTPTRAAMKVLAIDPGFDRMGIAVLEGDPSRPTVVMSDCITPPKGTPEERLAVISESVREALDTHSPDVLALERLFFGSNRTTAIGVAQARGAVLAEAGSKGVPVREFFPQEVKLAVTGYGAADKRSIALMVPKLVTLAPKAKRFDDELDAIALGIACLASARSAR